MPAGRFTDRARARRASRRASRGRRRGGAATARCARATPPRIAMGLRNAKQSGPGLARAPDMKLVRARWWGAAAGVVLAVADTLTITALGVRFELNGHPAGPLVAAWFGSSFVLLGFLVGYVLEGRRRDRRQAETIRVQTEAIAATRARLAQSERLAALGQLAAAVAHEVRSPLAVIRSAAQGLAESLPRNDEESRRAYSFITAEIDRLGNVVDSLLAFARPLRVEARPVSVHELFDRALLLVREELDGKALRVRRDEPPLLPEVRADGDLICQVLLGLLANAAEAALRRAGHQCETCAGGEAALAALEEHGADVVVTDWKMPHMDGIELLRRLHARRPGLPVILVTAHGTVPSAVAAMREGAFDYVTKPFDNDELRATVARALELRRLERENRWLRQEVASRYAPEAVVAESPGSRELLALVRRVAPSRATVLIQGESGTGKELVARLLHYWSKRVGRPFVAVNVKAFAEGVLESELFGHEKGAFTGAVAARAGCFERAHGGTLFLDEIAEIAPDIQVKLLRGMQEGEDLRVGGGEAHAVDARVVAATNRVLRDEIAAGRFREDLYFRLNVIPIQLLPLRARREDIVPLAHHFLAHHAAEAGRRLALSPEAEEVLAAHGWPGNVRELENAVERAVVLARGDTIASEDLLLEERAGAAPAADGTLQDVLDRAAAARIRAALDGAGGQRAEAARALGIDRTTLYRMMKRLGL